MDQNWIDDDDDDDDMRTASLSPKSGGPLDPPFFISRFITGLFGFSDPKTQGWPMMGTPWPTIAFVAVYLFIVKVGPKYMEDKKAWDLKNVLIAYNFALVLLSLYMVYEVIFINIQN